MEFAPPQHPSRALFRGSPVPIPTVAEAEKEKKPRTKDEDTNAEMKDSHVTMSYWSDATEAIPVYNPLHLDMLIPETPARVQLEKHTHEPAKHSSRGNSKATHISEADQQNQRISKGKGEKTTPLEPLRGGHRLAPPRDSKQEAKSKKSPNTHSSWPARWHDWKE